ncbi:jg21113 [Pararge aegeria aegeria]|uniref:Jg21113 protein n=1 Tax=Pararge aegeria aegeria TaxID=348720 RepID=A0A8S4RN19_9NEOP|nr:jg21113 [Pararge aegeria aegeria]
MYLKRPRRSHSLLGHTSTVEDSLQAMRHTAASTDSKPPPAANNCMSFTTHPYPPVPYPNEQQTSQMGRTTCHSPTPHSSSEYLASHPTLSVIFLSGPSTSRDHASPGSIHCAVRWGSEEHEEVPPYLLGSLATG